MGKNELATRNRVGGNKYDIHPTHADHSPSSPSHPQSPSHPRNPSASSTSSGPSSSPPSSPPRSLSRSSSPFCSQRALELWPELERFLRRPDCQLRSRDQDGQRRPRWDCRIRMMRKRIGRIRVGRAGSLETRISNPDISRMMSSKCPIPANGFNTFKYVRSFRNDSPSPVLANYSSAPRSSSRRSKPTIRIVYRSTSEASQSNRPTFS